MRIDKGRVMTAARKLSFDVSHVKKDAGGGLIIEGFANRAVKDGKKVVDRAKEHIAANEWRIDEWQKNSIIFFNHDPDLPIGHGIDAKVLDDGLWIKVRVSKSSAPDITKVRDLIEEGTLRTFSVGIDIEDEQEIDGVLHLKGVKLLEVSVVSIPMNQESFFSISQKMLKDQPKEKIRARILRAKGAWVAAAVHNRVFEMQREDAEFDRNQSLVQAAQRANISMEQLMDILAGNTVDVSPEVISAFSQVFGLAQEDLEKLNKADWTVANRDSLLNPTVQDQAEDESDQEDGAGQEEDEGETDQAATDQEAESQEDQEDELIEGAEEENPPGDDPAVGEVKPEDDEDEPKAIEQQGQGIPEDDQELLEDEQNYDLQDEDDDASLVGKIREVLGGNYSPEESMRRLREVLGVQDDEDNPEGDFKKSLTKWVRQALNQGLGQDQAIAFAITANSSKGIKPQLDNDDWHHIFKVMDEHRKEKNTGIGVPMGTVTSTDQNPGNADLEASRQTNVLLGQLIGEIQRLVAVMTGQLPAQQPAQTQFSPHLSTKPNKEKSEDLDLMDQYRAKLDQKLKILGV